MLVHKPPPCYLQKSWDGYVLSVPCCGQCEYKDIFFSLPAIVSNLGVERILEVNMDEGGKKS